MTPELSSMVRILQELFAVHMTQVREFTPQCVVNAEGWAKLEKEAKTIEDQKKAMENLTKAAAEAEKSLAELKRESRALRLAVRAQTMKKTPVSCQTLHLLHYGWTILRANGE